MTTRAEATRADRWMFAMGAAWTIGIGGSVLVAPRWALEVFYHRDPATPDPLLWMTTGDFGMGVLLFGLGYALVAVDPEKNRGFVQLGILGKVLVVLGMVQRFVSGVGTQWVLAAALADLVFAILYARFLWRTRVTAA
jgi:hypothetical protein